MGVTADSIGAAMKIIAMPCLTDVNMCVFGSQP